MPFNQESLYEQFPELYWNLVLVTQFIKAPSIYFEYYQNNFSISEAFQTIGESLSYHKQSIKADQITDFSGSNPFKTSQVTVITIHTHL